MQGATDNDSDTPQRPRFRPCPWQHLETVYDVELWIEEHNRSLQEHIRPTESGYGVCFTLAEGGEIFMQTSADGAVILDVTADADWVAPLICAATQCPAPGTSLWILPDDKLIQLIAGLSSLVASTTLVVGHHFGVKRRAPGLAR
ncbi:hypothetical protein [Janthinobacterium fluminis]|uniref:Uncharacterized protein n=1 Tax=Janthinobacterium fluminis TaxID=2987524 RepID=A0ABT5JVG1_9BURK|nr:hypothetical protein [Janthinobacterium fluminis]MDC8756471.1 hypothetical protein [Janthinobacterium fluminis]